MGVGTAGGAEAVYHVHAAVDDTFRKGLLAPLVCMQVDESNCFGNLERSHIRDNTEDFLPNRAAALRWKQRFQSYIHVSDTTSVEKDRGAEQGDVDGPLEA